MKLDELNEPQLQVLKRFARNDDSFESGVKWLSSGLTVVTTLTAFQLARGGREVFAVYPDGSDSLLDDVDSEDEYYPDKTKSWPEIETIFLVEGSL